LNVFFFLFPFLHELESFYLERRKKDQGFGTVIGPNLGERD